MSNLMLTLADASAQTTFCTDSANIWQVVGYVLLIFKIVIPVLVIILGMIDLGKAVVSGKDDEVKKNIKSLMWRAIAAVVIFFVPTFVNLVFDIVNDVWGKNYEICGIEEQIQK